MIPDITHATAYSGELEKRNFQINAAIANETNGKVSTAVKNLIPSLLQV